MKEYIFESVISIPANNEKDAWERMSNHIADSTGVDDLYILKRSRSVHVPKQLRKKK